MNNYYNTDMKEITKKFKNNIKYDLSKIGDVKRLLFFDIETTGLSPKNSNLYLIGSININNDTVISSSGFVRASLMKQLYCKLSLNMPQTLIH